MKKFIYFSLALVCSIMTLAKEIHFRLLTGKIDFCFPNFGSYSLDVELSAPGSGDGSKGLYSFQDSFDRVSKSGGRHLRPYEAFSILISGLHLRFSDGSDLAMIKNDMYNGGEWLDAGFVRDRARIVLDFEDRDIVGRAGIVAVETVADTAGHFAAHLAALAESVVETGFAAD